MEDKPIKEQIEDKKKALKEKNDKRAAELESKKKSLSEKLQASKEDQSPPSLDINDMSTEDIFEYLISRVVDERSSVIIEKAKSEYDQLSERIGESEARSEVGNVLKNHVQSKLMAAQAINRIPQGN